jgi:small nuclear ribonucleoprotein (snRNP)-like protein
MEPLFTKKRRGIVKSKTKMKCSIGTILAAFIMFSAAFSALPSEVNAKTAAIEGVSYNVDADLLDNFKLFIGKKVNVTLESGKTLSGIVKKVGAHLIHLEKLDGKEFYDALIRIEDVSAIDTRFREFKR